jgi:hypothetical protein
MIVMPMYLPSHIAAEYRPLERHEVRAESFGKLTRARLYSETDWRKQVGTFDDQRIFGTRRRYRCACGKYDGKQYAEILCDECGVKVTTPDVRRRRGAHINLAEEISHPLGGENDRLIAVPVLPVSFVEAENGAELVAAYDLIIRGRDEREIAQGFARLCEVLSPVLVMAHRWDLADRLLIAHGMGLKERGE